VKECDYWVVCEGLSAKEEKTICPKENTILITCEPPTIKRYKRQFLDQFARVITCHPNIDHANPIFLPPFLPWHIGRRQRNHVNLSFSKDYDELASIKRFDKDKLISVISSDKASSEGHQLRLNFLQVIKGHLGDRLDVFGRGIQEIEDKWDALAPYKYHIALENSSINDYWTEKLTDAFLAGCHPIYYGCANIDQYFSPLSLTKIDISNPEKAVQIIDYCIKESKYEQTKNHILEARDKVLNQYNLFAILYEHVSNDMEKSEKALKYSPVRIRKERSDSNLLYRAKKIISRLKVNHGQFSNSQSR
jgi:hypothetical protein